MPLLRFFPSIFILSATLLTLYFLLSPAALPKNYQMHQKAAELSKEIVQIKINNLNLISQIELLSAKTPESLAYIENLARQSLGLVAPGETVVILTPNKRR